MDRGGEAWTHAAHSLERGEICPLDRGDGLKVFEQRALHGGTDPWDVIEGRANRSLSASLSVVRDGEAVSFVPNIKK